MRSGCIWFIEQWAFEHQTARLSRLVGRVHCVVRFDAEVEGKSAGQNKTDWLLSTSLNGNVNGPDFFIFKFSHLFLIFRERLLDLPFDFDGITNSFCQPEFLSLIFLIFLNVLLRMGSFRGSKNVLYCLKKTRLSSDINCL